LPSFSIAEDSFTTVATGRYGSYNWTISQYPSHGVLTPITFHGPGIPGDGGTTFRYTPYADYYGSDGFVVEDNHGTNSFDMTVTPEADAPAAVDDQFTGVGYRVAAAELLKNDFDVDRETLTVASVGPAVNGSVALRDGYIIFTPTDPAYRGDAVFTYAAADPTGRTDTATVTLKGAAASTPPVVNVSGPGDGAEGSGGNGFTPFNFTVTRAGDLSSTSDVAFFVWHETTDGRDIYMNASGSVRLNPGEASTPLTIYVTADTSVEPDETFHVQLYDPKGATLGANVDAKAVIRNDDGPSQAPPPPLSGGSQVLTASDAPGQTLVGGPGNDTLTAGRNDNNLTGAGGGDAFVFKYLPWNAGHVTDFTPGTDVLDLRLLFERTGYTGRDPIADHLLEFRAGGSGDTQVYFDPDGTGNNPQWPFLITALDHITPSQLGAADWLFK